MTTVPSSATPGAAAQPRIVPRRAWAPWVLSAVLLALLIRVVIAAMQVRIVDLSVIGQYLISRDILIGVGNALSLGTLSLVIALMVGLVVALTNLSTNPILSRLAGVYIYVFRGTPFLIQIIFWFNALPTMFPALRIAIPFVGVLYEGRTIDVITPYVASLIGLGLGEAAYMAEILRAGLLAVDAGQRDAARALGLTPARVMRRIVIPQASRIVLPSVGNQYISLLKSTSLASVIGYMELVRVSTDIYSSNFRVVELLAVSAFWYLVLAALVTTVQYVLERAFPQR